MRDRRVGTAREIAARIVGAPVDALTDADVWPELARRCGRPVVVLDRDTGWGRCYGRTTDDGPNEGSWRVRRVPDGDGGTWRFDDGTTLRRGGALVVRRRGMFRFAGPALRRCVRRTLARLVGRLVDQLEGQEVGSAGPDVRRTRCARSEPADGDAAGTGGMAAPPVAAAQRHEQLMQAAADGPTARRGTALQVPLEGQGLGAAAETGDDAQAAPAPVPGVPRAPRHTTRVFVGVSRTTRNVPFTEDPVHHTNENSAPIRCVGVTGVPYSS
jgi:hypothetical protein